MSIPNDNQKSFFDDHQDALHFMTRNVIHYIHTLRGATHAQLLPSSITATLPPTTTLDPTITSTATTTSHLNYNSSTTRCSIKDIETWEHENDPYKLPMDLKQFYSVTNGLILQWYAESIQPQPPSSSDDNDDDNKPIITQELAGYSRISPLKELCPISSDILKTFPCPTNVTTVSNVTHDDNVDNILEKDCANDTNELKQPNGIMNESFLQGFVLEDIPDYGKVVLLYGQYPHQNPHLHCHVSVSLEKPNEQHTQSQLPSPSKHISKFRDPTIWFFNDRYQGWDYLTSDFSCYFRLMLVHLGIVGWQYAFVTHLSTTTTTTTTTTHDGGESHNHTSNKNTNKMEEDRDVNSLHLDPRCLSFMQRFAPERLVVDVM